MDVENANCKLRVSQCADMEILPIERPLKVNREIDGLEILLSELHRVFSEDHVNVQDVQKLMAGYNSDQKHWRKYAKFDRFRYTRNLVDSGNGSFNVMILCWGPGHASAIHDHADSHCFMKILSGSLEEVRYDWPKDVEPEVLKKLKNNAKSRRRCCSESEDRLNDKTDSNITCHNDSCHNFGGKVESDFANGGESGRKQNGDSNGVSHNGDSNGVSHNGDSNGVSHNGDSNGVSQNGGDSCNNGSDEVSTYEHEDMVEIGRNRLDVNDVCYINDALGLHRVENSSHVSGAVSLHLYCPPFDACRVFDARTGRARQTRLVFTSRYGRRERDLDVCNTADSQN